LKILQVNIKDEYSTKNLDYVPIAINQKLIVIGVKIVILKDFNKDLINGLVEMNI